MTQPEWIANGPCTNPRGYCSDIVGLHWTSCPANNFGRKPQPQVDYEVDIGRDEDGGRIVEVATPDGVVTVSVEKDGTINWATFLYGVAKHGSVKP